MTIRPGPTMASRVFSLAEAVPRAPVSSTEMVPRAPRMSPTCAESSAAPRISLAAEVIADHPFRAAQAADWGARATRRGGTASGAKRRPGTGRGQRRGAIFGPDYRGPCLASLLPAARLRAGACFREGMRQGTRPWSGHPLVRALALHGVAGRGPAQPLGLTPYSGERCPDPERLSTGGISGLCPWRRLTEQGVRYATSPSMPAVTLRCQAGPDSLLLVAMVRVGRIGRLPAPPVLRQCDLEHIVHGDEADHRAPVIDHRDRDEVVVAHQHGDVNHVGVGTDPDRVRVTDFGHARIGAGLHQCDEP